MKASLLPVTSHEDQHEEEDDGVRGSNDGAQLNGGRAQRPARQTYRQPLKNTLPTIAASMARNISAASTIQSSDHAGERRRRFK